jgi:hypothetical protein
MGKTTSLISYIIYTGIEELWHWVTIFEVFNKYSIGMLLKSRKKNNNDSNSNYYYIINYRPLTDGNVENLQTKIRIVKLILL